MTERPGSEKGVVLFIVLAALFVVVILANIVLSLIASQSRLTHHQVSRIQAYYAAKAGVIYGLEQLRTGNWVPGTDCRPNNPCLLGPPPAGGTCLDPDFTRYFPASINSVNIVLRQAGTTDCQNTPAGVNACVSATADYAYTAP